MGQRLRSVRLFDAVTVASTASAQAVSAGVLDLRVGVISLVSLMFVASSVVSTANVRFLYRMSPNNVAFGSYADNADITSNTKALANPQAWNMVTMPALLAPFVQVQVMGMTSNPTDTVVTADVLLRTQM